MVRLTGRIDSILRFGILTAFIAVSMTASATGRSKKKVPVESSAAEAAASTTVSTAVSPLHPGGLEWKSIVFGQSTSVDKNSIFVDNSGKSVTITAGKKDGTIAGGKVATTHDGIAYYYTTINPSKNFVLTAKVKVNFFAMPTPDNQEAFGIMARDAIGKNLDADVYPSNAVLVGGYHGKMQSAFRNFVRDTTGTGGKFEDVFRFGERPVNDGTASFTLTMRKTNTGYHVSVDNAPEKIYYRPKQLEVLDSSNIYVGFFAASVASITVSDIVMTFTDAGSDLPAVAEPVKKVVPTVTVVSPKTTGLTNYLLGVTTNYSGILKIKSSNFDSSYIIDKTVGLYKELKIKKGTDTFHLTLIPDSLRSDTVKVQHVVTMKSYGAVGGIVYASPAGTDSGSGFSTKPLDLQTAIDFLQPSQTIILLPGVYKMKKPIVIGKGNDGTALRLKTITGSNGTVLDFSESSEGMVVFGNYWRLNGFDVTRGAKGGIRICGKYNILEMLHLYANGNTGLQISGYLADKQELWPSHNLVLNCESYNNKDASETEADGFGAKLAYGPGNVFRGCIAHHNSNNGWNLYSRVETGPVVIENCISYCNGMLTNSHATKGNGNGFKLGGEGLPVAHVLRNSIAFGNKGMGITNNSDPAVIVENCSSFDNGGSNFDFSIYNNAKSQFIVNNNISFHLLDGMDDKAVDSLKSPNNYFYTGKTSSNSEGKILTRDDFKSVTLDVFKRNADGSIAGFNYTTVKPTIQLRSGAKITDLTKVTKIAPAPKVVLPVLVPAPDSAKLKAAAAKADSIKRADSLRVAAAKAKSDSIKAAAAVKKAKSDSIRVADSIKVATARKARADSIKTADSLRIAAAKAKSDSIKAAAAVKKAKSDSIRVADSIKVATARKARADSIKTADSLRITAVKAKSDSIKAAAAVKKAKADSIRVADSIKVATARKARADSIKTADSLRITAVKAKSDSIKAAAAVKKAKADSIRVADSIKVATARKARADSIKTADSLRITAVKAKSDSIKAAAAVKKAKTDSIRVADSLKVAAVKKAKTDSIKVADSLRTIAKKVKADSLKAVLSKSDTVKSQVKTDTLKATITKTVQTATQAKVDSLKVGERKADSLNTVPKTLMSPVDTAKKIIK